MHKMTEIILQDLVSISTWERCSLERPVRPGYCSNGRPLWPGYCSDGRPLGPGWGPVWPGAGLTGGRYDSKSSTTLRRKWPEGDDLDLSIKSCNALPAQQFLPSDGVWGDVIYNLCTWSVCWVCVKGDYARGLCNFLTIFALQNYHDLHLKKTCNQDVALSFYTQFCVIRSLILMLELIQCA